MDSMTDTELSLAGLIPPRARSVLELGCGVGVTGKRFKEIQPECRYFGIDSDREKLRQAAKVLDRAAVEKDWDIDLSRYGLDELDCIMIHGAFWRGHEREAAGRLAYFCGFLSKDGQIVLTAGAADSKDWLEGALTGLPLQGYSRMSWIDMTVIRLFRTMAPPLRIHTFAAEPITAHIRTTLPTICCNTEPGVIIREEYGYPDVSRLRGDEQICMIQRCHLNNSENAEAVFSALAGEHRLLINEFDDAPFHWHTDPAYSAFVGVHVVQTSTPALADVFREYNPYVLTVENQVASLPPLRQPDLTSDHATIFFGAINRREDWQEIMPVLDEAIQRYGARLSFLVVGNREFYDALRAENKEYFGGSDGEIAPYDTYLAAMQQADIALLPLRDTPFNRLKSDLKFIEAASCGTVALAAPTVYARTLRDGRTGFLYHDLRELRQLLSLLIENPLLRWETAQLAYAYVRENRLLANHYRERLYAYRELLAHRDELELERRMRMAKLRHVHVGGIS